MEQNTREYYSLPS